MRSSRFVEQVKATLTACLAVSTLLLTASDALAQRGQKVPPAFDILPITITGVTVQNGQLVASGLLGANPFTTPVTVAAAPSGGACPILDLSLGPIDLNLLGLRVQTSPICLQITAYGGGGLLGELLCGVANLLQGGMPLSDVLAGLEAQGQLPTFLNALTTLFDQALNVVTSNQVGAQQNGAVAASCTVLTLSLGPIELNLLGLDVILDNCAGGPVTVDITAIPGGGLLGDLLCSLTDLLNTRRPPLNAIQTLLFQISRVLGGLLG